MKKFKKPSSSVEVINEASNYGRFVISPLERGFGMTLGNSLRRVLLSSLPGASLHKVEIERARHAFSALDGVVEDVTAILLNLKGLILNIEDDDENSKKLTIDIQGPKTVTGKDISCPTGVEVINKDVYICTVSEGATFRATLYAKTGRGYLTAEQNKGSRFLVGEIPTDSNFSPVTKVALDVEPARVGHDLSYEKLTLDVWTNGAMPPQAAVAFASRILMEHLNLFVEMSSLAKITEVLSDSAQEPTNRFQNMTIEDLELSVRSYNCLKRAGIQTVEELTQKTEEEMMKVRNLGKKSLKEVKEMLQKYSLDFKKYE